MRRSRDSPSPTRGPPQVALTLASVLLMALDAATGERTGYMHRGGKVIGWGVAVAAAADLEVEVTLHGRVGQPYVGATPSSVRVPSPVRPPVSVTTEADGFTLTCSGRGREVRVWLAYDVAEFPKNGPVEFECVVGAYRLKIHVTNDDEVAWRLIDHPTVRLDSWDKAAFRLGPGWPDAPGRLVRADYRAVDGLACYIEHETLFIDRVGTAQPGAYRCIVDGHEPVPVEVLPASE